MRTIPEQNWLVTNSETTVIPGIDVAAANDFAFLNSASVGVLANQASLDTSGVHLVEHLRKSSHCKLTQLFAPEHGFFSDAQDMEPVSDQVDSKSEIEIRSLYGETERSLRPSVGDFESIEVLVVDLTDIGSRYYTYSQTMAYCMKAAGEAGVKVVVLDRPNPIGGVQVEGSPLTKNCRSFCGIGPVANRHGMTLGELAYMFRDGFGTGDDAIEQHECELEVVSISGWWRSMYHDETGYPWVPPSPNMPSLEAAIVYPGSCLFETTNFSEGRGTKGPFELLGAPFVDPLEWIAAVEKIDIPLEGAVIRPVEFRPKFQKHAGVRCRGVQVEVVDRLIFRPYRFGIALLIAAAQTFSEQFSWRNQPYEFVDSVPAIDLLYGDDTLRRVIEGQVSIEELLKQITGFESWYLSARSSFLKY